MRNILLLCKLIVVLLAPFVRSIDEMNLYHEYNICNGLSNQLLFHAASIASGYQNGKIIKIPNHFIVNGAQNNSSQNVIPTASNSVPLGLVFDETHLLRNLKKLIGNRVELSTFNFSKSEQEQISCQGVAAFDGTEPTLVMQILGMFKPSNQLRGLIDSVTRSMFTHRNVKDGICVHHRDGRDWHDHCAKWKSIDDGIYRGNCLTVPGRTFLQALIDRGLSKGQNFIYYCGDHDLPDELKGFDVVRRLNIVSTDPNYAELQDNFTSTISPWVNHGTSQQDFRDLWALVDFFVCQSLNSFIGNSVSTFSALQIAQMQQNQDSSFQSVKSVSWYNSQSIPLGDFWNIYTIPIVYTYTEQSLPSGKFLLKVSILSARRNFPNTAIHILYHGNKDNLFRRWLENQRVIIHEHWPSWAREIEVMRQNGVQNASHLFLDAGNYLGTWQRIDIPLFVHSEYCLLLDSDTIVMQHFTARDFGLDMTRSIAMSDEVDILNIPFNAGVTLMNVPHLRSTYQEFLKFILQHNYSPMFNVSIGAFNVLVPSDQGAYLEFYFSKSNKGTDTRDFLSHSFNVKPYWNSTIVHGDIYILHFHGTKPAEYIDVMFGGVCKGAGQSVCERAMNDSSSYLCQGMLAFSKYAKELDFDNEFCKIYFNGNYKSIKADFCQYFVSILSNEQSSRICDGHLLREVATTAKNMLPSVNNYDSVLLKETTDAKGEEDQLPEIKQNSSLRVQLMMVKDEMHPVIYIPLLLGTNAFFIVFMIKNLWQRNAKKYRLLK